MRDIGGADPQSAFLRAVVVGPAHTSPLTVDLDRTLRDAGHDVTLLTGAPTVVGAALDGSSRAEGPRAEELRSAVARSGSAPSWPRWVAAAPAPRAGPRVPWSRLDTWARTGRRLRGVDVIVLVHSGAHSVPALLALVHGAGAGSGHDHGQRPRMVLVAAAPLTCAVASGRAAPSAPIGRTGLRAWDVGSRLTAALVQRVDAVLVHDDETAAVATELGAGRVTVTVRPVCRPERSVEVAPGIMPRSSTGAASRGALAAVRRLTLEVVAREVFHGLAVGSRLASGGFTTRVRREGHPQRLDLERTRTESAPRLRTLGGHAPAAGSTAVGLAAKGVVAKGATAAGLPAAGRPAGPPSPATGRDPGQRESAAISAAAQDSEPDTALSAEWAHYVGVLESLASPLTSGFPDFGESADGDRAGGDTGDGDRADGDMGDRDHHGDRPAQGVGAGLAGLLVARLTAAATGSRTLVQRAERGVLVRALRTPRALVPLRRGDLPEWVMPTDVLVDAADGDEAKVVAHGLGLPRVRDGAQAWSALGTLAAIIRIVDDGHRSAVVVDESGSRSPLTRWARAVGFAPVSLGLGGPHADLAAIDLEIETLDVIARVHPGGCDADDVDEIIGSSSWLLRPGGILVVTLPLGPADAPGAIAPADVRGVVARAHGFGFVLVGDLDGELSALMTAAAGTATSADTAYGLVRLTLRRQ